MVKVKISEKGGQQSNYEFEKPEVTVGRMKGNDIVLPKGNVSKKHARIYGRKGTLMIDDLDSTNGTYVNGRKVTSEHEITENDKIYIGDFILQVERDQQQQPGGPPQAPPQPPSGGAEAEGNQSNMSPPSPPEGGADGPGPRAGGSSGGGPGIGGGASSGKTGPGGPNRSGGPGGSSPGAGAANNRGGSPPGRGSAAGGSPVGGANRDNDNPLDSLDEKYSDAGDSGSSRRPRNSQNQASVGGGGAGGVENRRSGNASQRDDAVRSHPGGDSQGGPSGPDSGLSARNRSGADHPPKSSSPERDRRGTDGEVPGRRGSGTSARERGRATGERRRQDLAESQRREDLAAEPILPPELESEFDERFHEAQQEVAEELFEHLDLEDLPLEYPPTERDREEYEERVRDAVREAKPRRVDRDALVEVMTSEMVGLGPVEAYLDDPDVESIYVNRFDSLVIRREQELVRPEHTFSRPELLELAAHRLLGARQPEVVTDEVRFDDGTRVHVTLPPVTVDGPVLTFRKPPSSHPTLEELEEQGVMSEGMQQFLERAVESGRSILVASPTSSGKTTLLEALGREIPDGSRIITVEQTSQLELPQQGVVRLESSPGTGFDLEEVLETAVEMHPQRILLDECRGAEAYTWVSSAASATEGSMATLHGINASDALARLESLCLLGSGDISPRGLREQIARAVDLVVVIHRASDGTFRIKQIAEVQGVDLDAFRLNDVFYYRTDGTSGVFHPTGYIPLFYEDLRHLGMDVDLDIFRE